MLATEIPGTGSGDDASRYIYYVETLHSGQRVYLQRPETCIMVLTFWYALKIQITQKMELVDAVTPNTKI